MIRHIHHPSCPAGHTAGAACICPKPRRRNVAAEALAFVALLAAICALPLYLLWRYVA